MVWAVIAMTRFIFLRPCAFIWATILGFLVVTGLRAERALTSFSLRTQVASAAGSRALLNFTVEGTEAKTVLLRAVGPTLGSFGVPGVLPDPRLVLYNASGAVLTSNAGWGGLAAISAANARVGAFVLPTASKDAALLLTLGAGTYCAEVESVGGTDGVVLLEIYDADTAASSRLTYLAVQARLASVREQAAAGFSVSGSGGPDVIVRALGPGLAAAGVAETLGDPQLNVFNGVGQLVGSSQDWFPMTGLVEGGRAAGLLPLVGRDAGTVLTAAAAGAYSVVVSGAQDTTGVFLLEVACVDPNRSTQVAPALLQPPRDLVGASGGTLSIAAPAIGRPELAYQWRRNGVAIPGATTSLLTVNNFTAASVGAYTVAVSNAAGAIVSAPFNVTLGQPVVPPAAPVVLIPPISQSVGSGANVVFTVAASGQPAPSFQWLFNGQPIPGATLPTLTLTAVTPASAGDYSVRLTNASGSVVSTAARLIVAPDIAPKVYFGSFAGATGEFALLTRPDGTGALVGLQKSPPIGFVGRTLAINTFGSPSGRVDWLAVPLTRLETSVQGVVATNQVILSIGGGVGSLTADTAPITLGPGVVEPAGRVVVGHALVDERLHGFEVRALLRSGQRLEPDVVPPSGVVHLVQLVPATELCADAVPQELHRLHALFGVHAMRTAHVLVQQRPDFRAPEVADGRRQVDQRGRRRLADDLHDLGIGLRREHPIGDRRLQLRQDPAGVPGVGVGRHGVGQRPEQVPPGDHLAEHHLDGA